MKICRLLVAGVLMSMIGSLAAVAAEKVTVFAASSLVDVLGDLEKAYEKKTGADIRISYAASSALAHQIERGAPADLYLSANDDWIDFLIKKGFTTEPKTAVLAENTLVLVAPASSPPGTFERLAEFDFAAWIGSKDRLAIADPAHVPAGIYAKQALQTLGRWDIVKERLAIANNVRAALLLVSRGEAPLGIVYRTDARATRTVRILTAIPPETHDPIRYRIARLGTETSLAAATFWEYLLGTESTPILRKNGFIAVKN